MIDDRLIDFKTEVKMVFQLLGESRLKHHIECEHRVPQSAFVTAGNFVVNVFD